MTRCSATADAAAAAPAPPAWPLAPLSGLRRALAPHLRPVALVMAVVAFATGAVLLLPGPIADRLLADYVSSRALGWNQRLLGLLSAGPGVFEGRPITAEDRRKLDLFIASTDVFRFKMFNREGRIFYSSVPGEAGKLTTQPRFFDRVALGRIYYKTAWADAPAAGDGGAPRPRRILVAEVYTPVMIDGVFRGAFEFYRDITRLKASFVTRIRTALAVFSALGVLLSTAAIAMVSITGRRHLRRERARAEQEKRLLEEQTRLTREVRLLSELNEWLQSSRSLDELFEMVSAFMARLLPGCAGSIYVYSNSRDVLDGACSWNGGELHEHIRPDACWGLRRGRSYAYGESEMDFRCGHVQDDEDRPYFCFPILAHGETVGLMTLYSCARAGSDEFAKLRRLARMCAEQISLAIANVRLRDQLHHQSIIDPLTGLYNRRHFTDTLRRHLMADRDGRMPLALVSIDVDHFKRFNDNHGHDAGDMVLRAVGTTLRRACDGDELPCRLGGEEFMLLLPGTDLDDAFARAEALREAVQAITVRYGEKALPRISISAGIAVFPRHGASVQELMKAADNALYAAKAAGRNRCFTADTALADIPDAELGKPLPARPDAGTGAGTGLAAAG